MKKYLLLIPVVLLASTAFAQQMSEPEPFYCAAVVPDCDKDGNPLPPFDNVQSFCFEHYANACLRQLVLKLQAEKPVNCKKPVKKPRILNIK